MSILDLFTLLFKKLGDKTAISQFFQSLWKIPGLLKAFLIASLVIGAIYFGYTRIYIHELDELKTELLLLKEHLNMSIHSDVYHSDLFYMFEALIAQEYMLQYVYAEEQEHLNLLFKEFKINHPDAHIISDIEEIMRRNNNNFRYYDTQFKKSLYKCNPEIYNELYDTITINSDIRY